MHSGSCLADTLRLQWYLDSSGEGEPTLVPGLQEIALKSGEKVWSYAADFRGWKRGFVIMTRECRTFWKLNSCEMQFQLICKQENLTFQ